MRTIVPESLTSEAQVVRLPWMEGNWTDSFAELRREVEGGIALRKQAYSLVEGFCGPGGMSLGLRRAGFKIAHAFDIDQASVATHNRNLGNHGAVGDARETSGGEILGALRSNPGDLDLFAGGPPCQGFSKQKRGAHLGDQRNSLVEEYVRLVGELRPRFFFFENVAIFGQKRGKRYLSLMHERLADYELNASFANSADFGLAQTRERFLVVGRRRDVQGAFSFPGRIVGRRTTVGDVLAGLPEPPDNYTVHPSYANHQRARVTEINILRFSHVPQGGGWRDIPEELRLPCHRRVDTQKGGWPDVFGRLEWEGQCPTITGGFDSFTRGRYGHPLQDRPLTPREAARLQGFPDEFEFIGTRGEARSQIGNAVPPPVAFAVGTSILRALLVADGVLEARDPFSLLCEDAPVYKTKADKTQAA